MTTPSSSTAGALETEIQSLQRQLEAARAKLSQISVSTPPAPTTTLHSTSLATSSLHTLLLLSDSALPLGSFAFSSGLESFLAHRRLTAPHTHPSQLLAGFLAASLESLAGTALPYVLAAWRDPGRLAEWDDAFDAATPCAVARRASVAQGRALVTVWERSYRDRAEGSAREQGGKGHQKEEGRGSGEGVEALSAFSAALRASNAEIPANAHLAPLWGVVTRVLDVPLASAAYLFLFSHVRAVVSAAVRASVLGPYQAQSELANADLRKTIEQLVERYWDTAAEDAAQTAPVLDLWIGRHEKLYSRIFNS